MKSLEMLICGANYFPSFQGPPKKLNEVCNSDHFSKNEQKAHGLRATPNPNLGFLSRALVSISPEIVNTDFGMISCCKRAPRCPWLLSLALTCVRGSTAKDPPTVRMFSFVENFLVTSATAALFFNRSRWWTYDALMLSPLSPLFGKYVLNINLLRL